MTTLILRTNTSIYQVIKNEDGTIAIQKNGEAIQNAGMFINSFGGVESIINKCIEFNGSFQDYINDLKAKNLAQKESVQAERKAEFDRLIGLRNSENATATDWYNAFVFELKRNTMQGWSLVDEYFLSDNILSKTILSKIGSFTATPYDDGAIIIKAGNKRFSNNRRFSKNGSIIDLLN